MWCGRRVRFVGRRRRVEWWHLLARRWRTPRCGRWRLKPFELLRPVLLRPEGPLTLGDFLARPDPATAAEFRALGPEQRQALVLHYYLDLSCPEIASILDCPEGTVHSRLHYARRLVQTQLEGRTLRSTGEVEL